MRALITFFLIGFMFGGCNQFIDGDQKISEIPEIVNLTIDGDFPDYGKDSLSPVAYHTFQWFDLSKLEGVGKAIDTPFVYLRRYNDMIIVRTSDDIDNPYIIKNHRTYWHCKWICDDRGDSLLVDRFLHNKLIYEYIQRLNADGSTDRELLSIDTFDPLGQFKDQAWDIKKYNLGTIEKFDYNAGEHFNELIELKDMLYPRNRHTDMSNSTNTGIVKSNILRVLSNEHSNRAPKYIIMEEKSNIHYGEAPMGLFDERRDIERPYFIRRIK